MKDDPLNQSTIDSQVREQMAKHTLWLNADNFTEMTNATWAALEPDIRGFAFAADEATAKKQWRAMCAAALAVVEWRMGGRVRP